MRNEYAQICIVYIFCDLYYVALLASSPPFWTTRKDDADIFLNIEEEDTDIICTARIYITILRNELSFATASSYYLTRQLPVMS